MYFYAISPEINEYNLTNFYLYLGKFTEKLHVHLVNNLLYIYDLIRGLPDPSKLLNFTKIFFVHLRNKFTKSYDVYFCKFTKY